MVDAKLDDSLRETLASSTRVGQASSRSQRLGNGGARSTGRVLEVPRSLRPCKAGNLWKFKVDGIGEASFGDFQRMIFSPHDVRGCVFVAFTKQNTGLSKAMSELGYSTMTIDPLHLKNSSYCLWVCSVFARLQKRQSLVGLHIEPQLASCSLSADAHFRSSKHPWGMPNMTPHVLALLSQENIAIQNVFLLLQWGA